MFAMGASVVFACDVGSVSAVQSTDRGVSRTCNSSMIILLEIVEIRYLVGGC